MLKNISLSFLSGILLFLCWPPLSITSSIIFIALVPLFIVEHKIIKSGKSLKNIFLLSYLTFFIFNLLTTWWIYNAHIGGAVAAIILNSLFMAFVFFLSSFIKKKSHCPDSILILPLLWLSFEYLHFNWDLTWPWLSLGNVFSSNPSWVQWYSYTGVLGGTLWVLMTNLIIFKIFKSNIKGIEIIRWSISCLLIFLIPFLCSYLLYQKNKKIYYDSKVDVLLIQPNIDPYEEKFTMEQSSQTSIVVDLINDHITDSTDFIVLPETFLSAPIWTHRLTDNLDIKTFQNTLLKYTNLNIVVGATSLSYVDKSASAKRSKSHEKRWYEVYNSAILLNIDTLFIYHKSKLVPGAEKFPFSDILYPLIGDVILDIGNSTSLGNFGTQESPSIFSSLKNEMVAPVICYESIYPDYVSKFVNKGAQIIFIITNDGWWKDTSGYQQHSMYAKLRAIETRRYIARTANTGISSVINHLGETEISLGWNLEGVIEHSIPLLNNKTFYVRYGDYIGRISAFISIILILMLYVNILTSSFKR